MLNHMLHFGQILLACVGYGISIYIVFDMVVSLWLCVRASFNKNEIERIKHANEFWLLFLMFIFVLIATMLLLGFTRIFV